MYKFPDAFVKSQSTVKLKLNSATKKIRKTSNTNVMKMGSKVKITDDDMSN